MAAPQLNGFHFPSVTQVEPPSSHPPPPPPPPMTTTTTTPPPSQEGPDHHNQHHHVYKPQPHPYPHNHTPSPPGETSQPLDLRVTRGILPPEWKRSVESDSEDRCVKRARVEVVANPCFSPSVLENKTGSQISVSSSPYEYYSHNHCSLPYYYHHHNHTSPPGGEKEKSQSETPQHFSSSSSTSVVDNGLSSYYHQQEKRLYRPDSAVSGDGKHQESASSSAGISLGLPIPHSSVFTRSVSPLFQQSWHHSPMSVSSHAHHTLFHAAAAAATTASPHLHPDLFHQPLPLSLTSSSLSGVQQQGLLSSPISAPLHDGHGNLTQHPSPLSAYAQMNGGFPYSPQEVLPSPAQNLLPSPAQNLLPSPHRQSLVPSPSQSVLPPPPPAGNMLLPSPGQSLLLPSPSQNVLPSQGQGGVPSPGPNMLSSPQVPSPSLPKSNPPFPSKATVPSETVTRQNTSPSSQHNPQPCPPQEKQQELLPSQTIPQNSRVSPKPFYRPFEDNVKPPTRVLPPTSPALMEREEYQSHHEVPASSSSSASVSSATCVSACCSEEDCPKPSADLQPTKTGEGGGMGVAVSSQDKAKDTQSIIQQSVSTPDSGFASFPGQSMDTSPREFHTQRAKPSACTECSEADCSSSGNPNVSTKAKTSPIQDNAVLSSTSSGLDPLFTKPLRGTGRKPEAQPIKVIGTTPLARIREERAKQEAKAREERLREFIAHRQEYRNNGGAGQRSGVDNNSREASPKASSNDSEGGWSFVSGKNTDRDKGQSGVVSADMDGSQRSSSNDPDEEAVPSSSQGEVHSQCSGASQDAKGASQTNSARSSPGLNSVTQAGRCDVSWDLPSSSSCSGDSSKTKPASDAPVPPDPNIKITPLDYLISKVLVEKIDVPFKPENREIRDIYTGAKKGRLTLVDLIELQVEASLKA